MCFVFQGKHIIQLVLKHSKTYYTCRIFLFVFNFIFHLYSFCLFFVVVCLFVLCFVCLYFSDVKVFAFLLLFFHSFVWFTELFLYIPF